MSAKPRSRILVIDDEEIVRDSCLAILDGAGYDIVAVGDGTEGLEQAQERIPDLVLVDLMMPGISGFEVIEAMRGIDPTIVTIVITGYSTVESAVEAMKKGAFDFLPKPFTPDELRLIVLRGLERRNLVLEATRLRREKEMLQENFAAIVSHELRSPLSAVQQNLFVLESELEGKLDEAAARRVERMKTRIEDLLKMIAGWLRSVSVDVGSIRENFAPVDARACVAKAVESVQVHATRKDITIVTQLADVLPPVLGDEGSLTEALVNLLGNAVKYTHAGGSVTLTAAAAGGQVVLAVADTGIGIPPEDLTMVFDAFYRAKSGAAAASGAGLGLALTRRIVEAHGGTLSVESEVGKGTTFSIRLPVHDAGAAAPAPPPSAASTRTTGDMR
jgi:two-component system, sensor histidine kinase and response regulator